MNAGPVSFLFNLILYLYPRRFRRTFGKEMAEVHREVMAAAGRKGRGETTRRVLTELGGLLAGAVREQVKPLNGWFEKTLADRPVIAGMVGYAVGFALLGLPETLTRSIPATKGFFSPLSQGVLLFFTGWLGAALLSFTNRRKENNLFRQAAGLSQMITLLIISTMYNQLFPTALQTPPTTLLSFAVIMLYPMCNGLLIGLLLAILRERRREIPYDCGLGMAGFWIGLLASRLAAALMESFWHVSALLFLQGLREFIITLTPDLLLGAIIGIALGLAYRGIHPVQRQVTA